MARPLPEFHGFVGQRPIINSIKRLIHGCQRAGKPFPHTLLIGSSGSGKTQLCESLSKAMGTHLHYVLCGRETTRAKISETLMEAKFGDILFMDEIHALKNSVTEFLYPAMDNFKTLNLDNEWVSIKACTVVAASDRAGELRNAFRRRCTQVYSMQDYTLPELREITLNRASSMGILLSPQATTLLAKVCRGTPRNLRHMLHSLQLYFPDSINRELGKRDVKEFLKGEGIDSNTGLTPRDRAYLKALADAQRPLSVQSLSLSLGCDESFVSHEIEPLLVRLGFVTIDKGGRILTETGSAYASKCK